MKKIKKRKLAKIGLLILALIILGLFGKNIFDLLARSKRVNRELVQFYQPTLNVGLVKKAAEVLGR